MSLSLNTERIIKNSINLSNKLILGIESDLRDVHGLLRSNERDVDDTAKLAMSLRQENIFIRNQVLQLQAELDKERITRKNDSRSLELNAEEQKQAAEGELNRVVFMCREAESDRRHFQQEAEGLQFRLSQCEARASLIEQERSKLLAELKVYYDENTKLNAEQKQNVKYTTMLESSYQEMSIRANNLSTTLAEITSKHSDEVKTLEMECFKLKERCRRLEARHSIKELEVVDRSATDFSSSSSIYIGIPPSSVSMTAKIGTEKENTERSEHSINPSNTISAIHSNNSELHFFTNKLLSDSESVNSRAALSANSLVPSAANDNVTSHLIDSARGTYASISSYSPSLLPSSSLTYSFQNTKTSNSNNNSNNYSMDSNNHDSNNGYKNNIKDGNIFIAGKTLLLLYCNISKKKNYFCFVLYTFIFL